MPVSLYSATVPVFLQILPQMLALVDKAEEHCQATGKAPADLLGARLAPDMWPLGWQFRAAWSHSIDAIESALSGDRTPDFSDLPDEFGFFRDRLSQAIARLQAVDPARVDASETGDVAFSVRDMRFEFTGLDYLLHFALPNFHFHTAMAYAILRNQGLELGKRDYLGAIRTKG